MKRQFHAALLILAAPVAGLHAAEPDALATLDACVAKLDPHFDIGYERIAARCPDLARALEQTGWAAWLPQSWKESRNDLSAGSLAELRALVARELATQPAARAPRVERLNAVLNELGAAGQQRSGVWVRFKRWLHSLFERSAQQKREGSWLDQMVARIGLSDVVTEIITYLALGGVVALAGFIVVNELRLAGLLGKGRAGRASDGADIAPGLRARLTWSDVERAALVDQPRLLLELIAAKLTDLRRLPPAGGFTVREIVCAADLQESTDRAYLNELALTAERARYAQGSLPALTVQSAVRSARALLARLESRDTPPPSDIADAGISPRQEGLASDGEKVGERERTGARE
jgi:hypothetical protein